MTTSPYFTNNEVQVSFTAKDANGTGPTTATLDLRDPDDNIHLNGVAMTVSGTTVTYTIAETELDEAGLWKITAYVEFTGGITRDYAIPLDIISAASGDLEVYGMVSGVEMWVGDLISSRIYTDTTTPSVSQVQGILSTVSSEMNMIMEQYGYTTPVTSTLNPNTYRYLRGVCEAKASSMVLSMLPMEVYVIPDSEQIGGDRRTMLDRVFSVFEKRAEEGQLPLTRSTSRIDNMRIGSQFNDDGETNKPLFTIDRFDNPGSRTLAS